MSEIEKSLKPHHLKALKTVMADKGDITKPFKLSWYASDRLALHGFKDVGDGAHKGPLPIMAGYHKRGMQRLVRTKRKNRDNNRKDIFKMDENFNREAAAKAYDLIMKMDDEEARLFSTMVVHEVLHETIEKNSRTIQRHINDIVAKRVELAKKAVVRKYYQEGDTDEVMALGGALAVISKALGYKDGWGPEDRKAHPTDPKTGQFVRVSGGGQMKIGPHSYDLVSALGAPHNVSNATGNVLEGAHENFPSFEQGWNRDTNRHASNAQLYSRVNAGSKFLGQVAPFSPKAQVASSFGQFVGSHGPDAEKVFGPPTRKAMYRYRGTERTPDAALTELVTRQQSTARGKAMSVEDTRRYNNLVNREVKAQVNARVDQMNARRKNKITADAVKPTREEIGIARAKANEKFASQRSEVRGSARDAAMNSSVNYLSRRLPKAGLTDLQLKSGHTPPSEGVIINSAGKITVQASGYGDDHYLPFNLKNLKGLKGGEYVRTRAQGGPTSEDIYLGLMSGARRLTVTSRSGTFTVEFEDDFRGGRRYNQKAKRMTDRYEKLLDAVKSQEVQRASMTREEEDKIAQEVKASFAGLNQPESVINEAIRAKVDEAKTSTRLTPPEIEIGMQTWHEKLKDGDIEPDSVEARNMQSDIFAHMQDMKAHNFTLNAVGYKAALDALREQFPYYLKEPTYVPRKESYDPAVDRGYVNPRFNRPKNALAGYYDESINGGKKYSAQLADYQNRSTSADIEASRAENAPTGQQAQRPQAVDAATVRANITQRNEQQEYVKEAVALRNALTEKKGFDTWTGDEHKWLHMSDEDLKKFLSTPEGREHFNHSIKPVIQREAPELKSQYAETMALGGAFGRVQYDPERHSRETGTNPYSFAGPPEFMNRQPRATYETALESYRQLPKLTEGPDLVERDDEGLKREIDTTKMYADRVIEALKVRDPDARRLVLSNLDEGEPPIDNIPLVRTALDTGRLDSLERHILEVQKLRRLKEAQATATDEASGDVAVEDLRQISAQRPEPSAEQVEMKRTADDLRNYAMSNQGMAHTREQAMRLSDRIRSAAERADATPEEKAEVLRAYNEFVRMNIKDRENS